MQFSCDEVASLVQKLCENIGAVNLQHDKASITWIGTFLQMWAKELEDTVTGLWPGHLGPAAAWCTQPRGPGRGPASCVQGSPAPPPKSMVVKRRRK